jgi:ribosomal-protein-serine acetyltransferase
MKLTELTPVPIPEFIASDRLVIKRHEESFAAKMFHTIDADRVRLQTYLPWVATTLSAKDTLEYIRIMEVARERFIGFDYSMFRKSDGEYIGNIGVHTIAWKHRRCELGYWVTQTGEGHGFVTEAVKALESELFGAGFHRIEIRCSTLNARSASVPKNCGYELEGELKEDTIENGIYRTTLVFGKLAHAK